MIGKQLYKKLFVGLCMFLLFMEIALAANPHLYWVQSGDYLYPNNLNWSVGI